MSESDGPMTGMQHCLRCQRPMPDVDADDGDDPYCWWEAAGPDGEDVICPGCLTLAEENAIADYAALTPYEIELEYGPEGLDGP